jgi:hypothetical protein
MTVKASGRTALILATGLFVCVAAPSQAAADADNAAASSKSESATAGPLVLNKYAKHDLHHRKTYAHRRSTRLALKPSADQQASAADVPADDGNVPTAIPPSVANANAKLMSADAATGSDWAMSARANDILQAAADNPAIAQPAAETQAPAETQVVEADQLNEVDRTLQEGQPPAAAAASADAPVAPVPVPPVAASRSESSTSDHTSLIGKIFIAFGGLLTLASAARMFMS